MQISAPTLTWMQVTDDTINTLLGNEKTASKNYAFFIPNDSNYTMKN
jgi:hypothetical protein